MDKTLDVKMDKTDRRVIKTRKSLQAALLSLLREQPFEEIEIQAITERADTARVTFYRHYATKEELLLDVMEDIYQEMQARLQMVSVESMMDFQQTPPCQILFDFLELDRPLYKKLFMGSVSALIQQRIRHYLVQQIVLTLGESPRHADLPLGLIANHIASCVIGNIMWWLAEDVPYSGAYMARITHRMSLAGAMMFVGRGDEITFPSPDAWRVAM